MQTAACQATLPGHTSMRIESCQARMAKRRAMTLPELLAVVTILGIFLSVASARMGLGTLLDYGARADARRLAVDLHQARRRSIATGENHYLAFNTVGGEATGYTLYRRSAASGDVVADVTHEFPSNVVASISHPNAEFSFEGAGLAAYRITLTGAAQTWQIDVVPVTGAISVSQTAP